MNNETNEAYKTILKNISSLQQRDPSDKKTPFAAYHQRELALAKTNLEQSLMWFYAAAGSKPGAMTDGQ